MDQTELLVSYLKTLVYQDLYNEPVLTVPVELSPITIIGWLLQYPVLYNDGNSVPLDYSVYQVIADSSFSKDITIIQFSAPASISTLLITTYLKLYAKYITTRYSACSFKRMPQVKAQMTF